ncbi:MAG TPA: 3'-5' exonuclease [Oleiagrimonas sp.]|nr:3'-5' exonuclease [Oleiagrimonas sp.]
MAIHIPARSACLSKMDSAGERRFSERLVQKLEDDYIVWYNVPLGLRRDHPDFLVFHPRRGLLVLEVKDWKPDHIRSANALCFQVVCSTKLVKMANPLDQARRCAIAAVSLLENDPALLHPESHHHAGKLVMPWAYGVVLTNITRKQFDAGQLGEIIPGHLAICQDEMYESVDAEAFQQRLWAMFPRVFPTALTLPQIDRIRWNLFPDIRVEPGNGQFGLFDGDDGDSKAAAIPDLVKVMDAQQEQLARSMGSGHRIIHGVAGSGKTMILGFRATHLAQALNKPILVLCFNRTLAARLEQLMATRGLSGKVQVYNFHRWCRHMLVSYHVALPSNDSGDFYAQLVERVIHGVDRDQIPRFQYGAVLIDEGHDFEPDWYKLIVQMVDPNTNSLLVLYDDAQNIYGKADRRKVTWKSLGIEAQGHTTILKLNYRNTLEILSVARSFAHDLLAERKDDDIPLVAPESAGRRGPAPELARFGNHWKQAEALVGILHDEHERGRAWSDMAIIYYHRNDRFQWSRELKKCNIPHAVATERNQERPFASGDSVKLVTMHSSKGLEFPFVVIPDLGALPHSSESEAADARLLYVAMTRATEQLLLMHHSESVFTRRIRASINRVQQELTPSAEPARLL